MYQVERTISRKELQERLEKMNYCPVCGKDHTSYDVCDECALGVFETARCLECDEEFALHLYHAPQYFCSMMCETDYLIRQNGDVWDRVEIPQQARQMLDQTEQNEKELPF